MQRSGVGDRPNGGGGGEAPGACSVGLTTRCVLERRRLEALNAVFFVLFARNPLISPDSMSLKGRLKVA